MAVLDEDDDRVLQEIRRTGARYLRDRRDGELLEIVNYYPGRYTIDVRSLSGTYGSPAGTKHSYSLCDMEVLAKSPEEMAEHLAVFFLAGGGAWSVS